MKRFWVYQGELESDRPTTEPDLYVEVVGVGQYQRLEDALRDFIRGADWYRRCLEDVQDGIRTTGLKEAKVEYDRSLDRARNALDLPQQR